MNPYPLLLKIRNKLYEKGILKRCRPEAFTVSVGNLSMGGTGKTPTVVELAKFFLQKGFKVSILLRGYKRKTKGPKLVSDGKKIFLNVFEAGDEAYLYAKLLKGVPIAVAEKRCLGWELLQPFKPDILLLDDAFQHLSIERDFDIVLLTPKDLKERVFPFGRLREPISSLKRADFCLFSKTGRSEALENLCKKFGKNYGYLKLKGFNLFDSSLKGANFSSLKGKKVGIVSALGDNKTFQKQILELSKIYNFEVVKILEFRDHFDYKGVTLDPYLIWLTTFKDLFKLEKQNVKLYAVDREFELPRGLKEVLVKKKREFAKKSIQEIRF